jgi:N-acetylated-alpha-linked acidic dipeptidase
LINQVANDVIDPETGVSIGARRRAEIRVDGAKPGASARAVAEARLVADPDADMPIEALGSGSDYSPFLQHLGLSTIDLAFGGEGNSGGVYHSAYDTFEYHGRFVDPGFVYNALLARTIGRLVLRIADSAPPMQRAGDFADAVSLYRDEVRKLADEKREQAEIGIALLRDHAYQLAADPTKPSGLPDAPERAPHVEFAALDDAVDRLKRSARDYDKAFARNGAGLPPDRLARLQGLMQTIDQTLAPEVGLPGRPWYKNLIYAPGRFTGYGAKTLPGVREAIEEQRWADADRYAALTATALNAYADRLDQARAVLDGK